MRIQRCSFKTRFTLTQHELPPFPFIYDVMQPTPDLKDSNYEHSRNLYSHFAIFGHTLCSICIERWKMEALPFRQAINSCVLTVLLQQSMSTKPCTTLKLIRVPSTSISSTLNFKTFCGKVPPMCFLQLSFFVTVGMIMVCTSLFNF